MKSWRVKADQRIRGLWADRDSPYLASIFAKAKRSEPIDEEDEFRIGNSISVEIVRLRISHGQDEHKKPHLNGVNLNTLRRYFDVFPEQVSSFWSGYVDSVDPPTEFVAWIEAEIPELGRSR